MDVPAQPVSQEIDTGILADPQGMFYFYIFSKNGWYGGFRKEKSNFGLLSPLFDISLLIKTSGFIPTLLYFFFQRYTS